MSSLAPTSGSFALADDAPAAKAAPARPRTAPRSLAPERRNPSLYRYLEADPAIPMAREAREAQAKDLQRWTRRYLYPTVRLLVLWGMRLVFFVKRLLPFQIASEALLGKLSLFAGRWFVSPEAALIMMRHFAIETRLINFVARNAASDVAECDLLPTRVEDFDTWDGQNTVIRHDVNMFNLFLDLGASRTADVHSTRPLAELDFSDLELPAFDVAPTRRRLLETDLLTSLYAVTFLIALFVDEATAERAVNSFQLDESLLSTLANLTGDDAFRAWTPLKFNTWLGSPTGDIPRDLHWHMMVHEYAYFRLQQLRAQAQRTKEAA